MEDAILIPVTGLGTAVVSPEDTDLAALHWCRGGHQYARRTKRSVLLHRVIVERMLDRPLHAGEEVDHVDGNSLNNTRGNLRLATHQQNMCNTKLRRDNRSGVKGVTWDRRRGLWFASIRVHGRTRALGRYASLSAAAAAYERAAAELFGEFRRHQEHLGSD